MNTSKIKAEAHKLIKYGMNAKEIATHLQSKNESGLFDPTLLEKAVEGICKEYPDYEQIQKIMKAKHVRNIQDERSPVYLLDPQNRVTKISNKALGMIVSPKLSFGAQQYHCKFDYFPHTPERLVKVEGEWVYNTYEPPVWQEQHFYSKGKIPIKKSKLPEAYEQYLMHLVANDKDSFEYVLDWLANAIQHRNYCVLTTVGQQGIGKGVLGDIMSNLFGEKNYEYVEKRAVAGQFNGFIKNKRLVYCDELQLVTKAEENRFKALINDKVQIEQKGMEAETCINYASIYVSSNNFDFAKLTADDRRFSIINLTDDKLMEKFNVDFIASLSNDVKNIKQFGEYLYHRPVDRNKMLRVFQSKRTGEVRASSLRDWEEWFLEEYCMDNPGTRVLQKEVSNQIADALGYSRGPGRDKFKELNRKYPDKFTIKHEILENKKQRYYIYISENQESIHA